MEELDPELYTVAWLAPLEIEAQAALHMLDERHKGRFPIGRGDDYVFQAGDVCGHNIIVATLPAGQEYGTGSTAALASQVKKFFPNLWFGLLVGVAAGLPNLSQSPPLDIRLGDVLVGLSMGDSAGLIAYDLGKETGNDGFQPLRFGNVLASTETVVRSAIGSIKLKAPNDAEAFLRYYKSIKHKEHTNGIFTDPGQDQDKLYQVEDDGIEQLVERERRPDSKRTRVWYGPIGSGEKLMKNAQKRNELRDKYNVIGLEMEAAGTMNRIPVGVIRGVCDYGDQHKNKEWQPYAAAMAAAYAKAILFEIRPKKISPTKLVSAQNVSAKLSDRTSLSRTICFTVPFERDLNFIGREDIIAEIGRKFKVQRRVALAGIGGVGKSQIAIEYCYRFRDQHRENSVFWIHASTVSRIDQAYKDITRKLCLPGWNDPNVDTLQLVSEWLSDDAHGPWLLVLDNSDDMEIFFSDKANPTSVGSEQGAPLVNYFPYSSNGSTLITTRDKRVGERLANREKAILVLPMAKPEAESLLWSKVAKECSLDKTKSSELLEVLGYLPLAITQAAAYINENSITVEEYLEAICAEDSEIQDLLSEDLSDLRRDFESQSSVIRTWKVSFDQIRKRKPRAAEMLSLIAVLDRQGIPKTLLRRDGERGIEFTTALGTLQAFSLVTAEEGGTSFEIHRLVQLSTQRWLELQGETAKWREEALKVLTAAFPFGDYRTWVTCETLSPHAEAVVRYIFTSDQNLLQRAELLHNMSSYDGEQGRYNLAHERGSGALSTRKRVLGPEHPDTLGSMNNLALVLGGQGKYEAAKEMHRQALELREKALGPEHPDTLASMNNLALVLTGQGRYEAAEEMHRQALELGGGVLGLEHPDTLGSMNNLALVLGGQGKYEAAEEMHRQALELEEKVLGAEHPETLGSMNNLALVLRGQGKYEAAEEMHRQALELREKVLGLEHPDTLGSMNNLALVLGSQGKYEAAEEMHWQALELRKKVLGPEHPDTLSSMNSLALVLGSQGKYEAAEEMHRQALELERKVLGPEHPDTLASMNNLALVLQGQGKYEAAEEMHWQALELGKKVLGPEHLDTLASMNNLALVLGGQGKYEAAEEMHRQALELRKKVLGAEHPDTLASMNNLAVVLGGQGKYEATEEMHRQALELKKKVLGPEHPGTLGSMNNLALVLERQGKHEAAEEMHRQTLKLREKVLGPEHPDTLVNMNNLALVLGGQGKYEAAEEMHWQALELGKKVLGPEHLDTLGSMNNLALVLGGQGKYEAAEEVHRQALELRKKVLGAEHPDTLASMNNLAVVLGGQGKHEATEEMHRQALELREKVLSPEHLDTLASMNNLALVLQGQGKYEPAEEMHRQALELKKKALGPEHPDILGSMNNLALVLGGQGKYEAAKEMHWQALELREKALGAEHPDTLASMNNLALVLERQGKHEAAEEMHRQTLELREKVLGPEHPDTLGSMHNLAQILDSQKISHSPCPPP